MKKVLCCLAFVAICGYTQAQGFSIGPKIGVNMSNYTGGDIKADALFGFHLGGLLNFGIGDVFSIQPEVLFSTGGAKLDNAGNKVKLKSSYVHVPVMFKFRFSPGIYLELGPQVGFKTGEEVADQSIDKFANNLGVSINGGLGYESDFGLGVGLRYVQGITKVGTLNTSAVQNTDIKNSLIQLSLFYAIRTKDRE